MIEPPCTCDAEAFGKSGHEHDCATAVYWHAYAQRVIAARASAAPPGAVEAPRVGADEEMRE